MTVEQFPCFVQHICQPLGHTTKFSISHGHLRRGKMKLDSSYILACGKDVLQPDPLVIVGHEQNMYVA